MSPVVSETSKKVAFQKDGYLPILSDFNQKSPLQDIIKEICEKWDMKIPEQYALQYTDTKFYITQETRQDIRDGAILTLNLSPEKLVEKFIKSLASNVVEERKATLKTLAGDLDHLEVSGQAEDPTFAKEFLKRNGVDNLVKIVESGGNDNLEILSYTLAAIQELMEHSFTSWDKVATQKFVKKVASFVSKASFTDARLTQRALALLENIILNSTEFHLTVSHDITIENLIQHIQSANPDVQLNALALSNSMFAKTEANQKRKVANELKARLLRDVLIEKIINAGNIRNEMAHQLYVYQTLILNLLEARMSTAPDPQRDSGLRDDLMFLYNTAFEAAPGMKSQSGSNRAPEFKRLGFQNFQDPLADFLQCPPGLLAFDVMIYFAKKHQEQYVKIILENFGRDEEYECPFARCTKALTRMLCELLNIGEPPSDTKENYYPMFFSCDSMFEEMYCVSIQLLNKTWKEMRANVQDFSRVISVVKEQITRVLSEKPETIDKFKTKAFGLSYQHILKLMQQEFQERNILDSQSKPVLELREQILPDIQDLVRQQRLAQLVDGQLFSKFSSRGRQKEKYWYCRLSPNYRFLHFGDAEEDTAPPLEALPNKLPISEVTELVIGKNCPHMKESRFKKGHVQLAFSLLHDQEDHLDFIAPSPRVFSVWTDGLGSLLGKEMTSKEAKEDLETLLNMEMKLLLLDVENIPIPENPPQLPPVPDNYNFHYKYE